MWKEGFLEGRQVKLLSYNITESWRNQSGTAIATSSTEGSGAGGIQARPVGAVGGMEMPSPGAGEGISV